MKFLPLLLFAAIIFSGCCGCVPPVGPTPTPPPGQGETWTGTLTGTAVASAVCVDGTDSYYNERATFTLQIPAPGMDAAMNTYEVTEGTGTYSGTESGVEANGLGCATPPSVTSGTVGPAPVQVRIVQTQIQLNSSTILMPARFNYGNNEPDQLNSREILLNPTQIGTDLITGEWTAEISTPATGYVTAGGTFTLHRGAAPTPTPTQTPTPTPEPTNSPTPVCDQSPPPCPDAPPGGVLPMDPHIPSGSLCRGACGPDCPSTCTPLNDQHTCVTDSHGCVYLCVYKVISCGTHAGCREHDDCYDNCADRDDETVLCPSGGECHCACDLQCEEHYGASNCGHWLVGYEPYDSMLNFSNLTRQSGPFDSCPACPFGACPQ